MAAKKKRKSPKKSSKRGKAKRSKKTKKKRGNYVPFHVLEKRAARLNRLVKAREGIAKFQ